MRAANLKRICLDRNNIKANGCLALTKANWPKISVIDLRNYLLTNKGNKIEDKGCFHLSKVNWDLT